MLDKRKVYKEVSEILDIMGEKYKNKIPVSFLTFLKENQSRHYKTKIKKDLEYHQQDLLPETKVMLAYLYDKYWK